MKVRMMLIDVDGIDATQLGQLVEQFRGVTAQPIAGSLETIAAPLKLEAADDAAAIEEEDDRPSIRVRGYGVATTQREKLTAFLRGKGDKSVAQIESGTGIPRGSLHALLSKAMAEGYVAQVSRGVYKYVGDD